MLFNKANAQEAPVIKPAEMQEHVITEPVSTTAAYFSKETESMLIAGAYICLAFAVAALALYFIRHWVKPDSSVE